MSLHVLSKLMLTLANFYLQFLNNGTVNQNWLKSPLVLIIHVMTLFRNCKSKLAKVTISFDNPCNDIIMSLHVLSKLVVTLANFDWQFLNNVITCIIKTNGDLSQFWFTVPK
jgi:hypothetical protein